MLGSAIPLRPIKGSLYVGTNVQTINTHECAHLSEVRVSKWNARRVNQPSGTDQMVTW